MNDFLTNPYAIMAMNFMSQMGPSRTPVSPMQIIGNTGLSSMQQIMQQKQHEKELEQMEERTKALQVQTKAITAQQKYDDAKQNAISKAARQLADDTALIYPEASLRGAPMQEKTQAAMATMAPYDTRLFGEMTGSSARDYRPGSLQEMAWLDSLPPETREDRKSELLTLKRAGKVTEIAGVPTVITPSNKAIPLSSLNAEAGAEAVKISAIEQAKDDREFVEGYPATKEKRRMVLDKNKEVGLKLDQALADVGSFTTGFPAVLSAHLPGSPGYRLASTLVTIKANIGFDKLQQMRDASPTGGALGQVAIQELEALQNSISSLDQYQDAPTLSKNIQEIKKHYVNWTNAVKQAQEREILRYQSLTSGKKQQPTSNQKQQPTSNQKQESDEDMMNRLLMGQ